MIVDSHCHLDYPGARRAGGRGRRARGRRRRAPDGDDRHQARGQAGTRHALARRHPEVVCAVGVHPHEAGKEGLDEPGPLVELRRGIPRSWRSARAGSTISMTMRPATGRRASFRTHVQAARETGLPLVVHTRDADEDTMALLEEEMAAGPLRASSTASAPAAGWPSGPWRSGCISASAAC